MVVILEDPIEGFAFLKDIMDRYEEAAGMKMNLGKTKMLMKNMTEAQKTQMQLISKIEIRSKWKYLGINIFTL